MASRNDSREEYDWPVFDSADWVRGDITAIVFLDTLDSEAEDSWDVSEAQDGSVKAWVEKSGSDTTLYIAGDGGVSAPEDSEGLFVGYAAVSIDFGSAFHTDGVKTMRYLFDGCENLQTVDLSRFDFSNVTSTNGMFSYCSNLRTIGNAEFDFSNIEDTGGGMFYGCDLLDTSNLTGY